MVPLIFLNSNGLYFQWDLGSYCCFFKKKKSKDSSSMHLCTLKIQKVKSAKMVDFLLLLFPELISGLP